MRAQHGLLVAALTAASGVGCHHGRSSAAIREAFAHCAPGDDIDACARALNAAGVICEHDAKSQQNPLGPTAYRCTMEQGRWGRISVLGDPVAKSRISYLSLDALGASKDDLDALIKVMTAACGGPGKEFNLSAASGHTWIGPGETSAAEGSATASLADEGMTLEEAFTASRDFGPSTSWLATCEHGTVANGPM